MTNSAQNPKCQCGHFLSDHLNDDGVAAGSCFYSYNCDCKEFRKVEPTVIQLEERIEQLDRRIKDLEAKSQKY